MPDIFLADCSNFVKHINFIYKRVTILGMKNSKILKWVLVVALVIVLNLFFNVATRLVYPEPMWEKYCPQKQVNISPDNEQDCVVVGGAWNAPAGYGKEPRPVTAVVSSMAEPQGYCDVTFTCGRQYNDDHRVYNRNVFVVMVVLGLISIFAGFMTHNASAVSLGLSFGGVISLVIGSVRYWSDMQEYLRLIILAIALVALIWLGYKKIKE